MKVRQKATVFPAVCGLTGSSHGPFLDTHMEYDVERNLPGGRIYFKVSKVREMGKACGMVDRSELDELKSLLGEAARELERKDEEIVELSKLADAVHLLEHRNRPKEAASA